MIYTKKSPNVDSAVENPAASKPSLFKKKSLTDSSKGTGNQNGEMMKAPVQHADPDELSGIDREMALSANKDGIGSHEKTDNQPQSKAEALACGTEGIITEAFLNPFIPEAAPLPDDFIIDKEGSLFRKNEKGYLIQITAGTPIFVISQNRTYAGEDWSLKIKHRDADGRLHERDFRMSDIVAGRKSVAWKLVDSGLVLLPDMEDELLSFLQKSHTKKRVILTKECGWLDETYTVFVLPNQVIGDVRGEQVFFQQEEHSPTTDSMREAGSLEQWQNEIATPVKQFPLAMFALMTAFVGVLLRILRLDGGGFNFFGPSSKGKTTLLQVAACVFGVGSDPSRDSKSLVQRWLQTANALEAISACHSDILICLDELGSSVVDLGHIIYVLAGGAGKVSMDSHRRLKQTRSWRGNILSTGEKTTRDAIEEGGKQFKAGHQVRLIDVPAVDIFRSPDGNSAEFVNDLKEKCATYYGTAGPEMVKRLIYSIRVNPDQVLNGLRADFDASVKSLTPEAVTPEQGRAIRRFAAVAVAGKMAAKLGILPYSPEEIHACVVDVRTRYLSYSPSVPDSQRGLLRLQEFLIVNHNAFPSIQDRNAKVNNAKGFRNDRDMFLLTTEQMASASNVGISGVRELAKALNDKKLLYISEIDRLKSKHKIASAGGKYFRFYAIRGAVLEAEFGGEDRVVVPPGNTPKAEPDAGEVSTASPGVTQSSEPLTEYAESSKELVDAAESVPSESLNISKSLFKRHDGQHDSTAHPQDRQTLGILKRRSVIVVGNDAPKQSSDTSEGNNKTNPSSESTYENLSDHIDDDGFYY